MKPADIILEIGTGSGYQTAILAGLVQHVYSVEIITELATSARKRLYKLGYNNVEIHNDDGYFGWPEHAPYNGIIVTAAAPYIPQPLIDQLRPGARLVIPVGLAFDYQTLMVVEKKANGNIETGKILGVSLYWYRNYQQHLRRFRYLLHQAPNYYWQDSWGLCRHHYIRMDLNSNVQRLDRIWP